MRRLILSIKSVGWWGRVGSQSFCPWVGRGALALFGQLCEGPSLSAVLAVCVPVCLCACLPYGRPPVLPRYMSSFPFLQSPLSLCMPRWASKRERKKAIPFLQVVSSWGTKVQPGSNRLLDRFNTEQWKAGSPIQEPRLIVCLLPQGKAV